MYSDESLLTLPVIISICAIIISAASFAFSVRNRQRDKRFELNQRKIDLGLKLAQAMGTGYKLATQFEELYKLELNEEDKKRVKLIHNKICLDIAKAEALYARAKNDYFKNNPEETQYIETEATVITLKLNTFGEYSTQLLESVKRS